MDAPIPPDVLFTTLIKFIALIILMLDEVSMSNQLILGFVITQYYLPSMSPKKETYDVAREHAGARDRRRHPEPVPDV